MEKFSLEEDSNDFLEPVSRLVQKFELPLESAGANNEEICSEFKEMIWYGTQYISLATLDYCSVWWRLFHSNVK